VTLHEAHVWMVGSMAGAWVLMGLVLVTDWMQDHRGEHQR
jgi:hypothetical protein